MRVLLIGAPGSGKGTQGERIAEHFGIAHISSGDLLREHVARNTPLGQVVRGYLERGDLVPDSVMMDMLRKPVVAASMAGGYVLDGFPRTVEQAEAAYVIARELGVAIQVAVYLAVPKEELIRRLLARKRGAEDSEAIIAHRIEVFEQHTLPMVEYYAEREKLVTINGARPPDEVTWSIRVQLERALRQLN